MYGLRTLEENKRIFRNNMLYYINELEINIKDMAEDLGIAAPTIHHYLRGESLPNIHKAYLIANYFECTIDDLLNGREQDDEQADENYIR